MVTIKLNSKEASTLRMFLLLTTKYRREEADACWRLSREKEPDGTPSFPKMRSNAEWWEEADRVLKTIGERLDAAPREPDEEEESPVKLKYIKETATGTGGRPYTRTEITRAEALEHVTAEDLAAMEANVRRAPGIGELLEVGPGTYVGVATN